MKYIFSFILMAALLAGLWAVDLRFGVGVDAAGETLFVNGGNENRKSK